MLSGMDVFFPSGNDALVDKTDHSGAEQLSMKPQISVAAQKGGNRVGNASKSQLDRCTVRHQLRDGPADDIGLWFWCGGDNLHEEGFILHNGIELGNMHQ